jgi:integrase
VRRPKLGVDEMRVFERKVDGRTWARSVLDQIDQGTFASAKGGDVLVRDLYESWIATKRSKSIKTIESYRSLWRAQVEPRFGDRRIGGIRPSEIAGWLSDLTDAGLSPSRITQCKVVLSQMFKLALDDRLVAVNPVASTTVRTALPAIPRKTIDAEDVPTSTDVARIIGAVDERYRALLAVLAYGGLRFGEAAGLRRRDVRTHGLTVEQAVVEVEGTQVVQGTKDHETRFVEMPQSVLRQVRDHMTLCTGPSPDALVFTTTTGTAISVTNFNQRQWATALRQIGLPHRKLHILRAFAAMTWLAHGADIEYLRDQLGHASITTTARYLVLRPLRRTQLVEALDAEIAKGLGHYKGTGIAENVTDLAAR